MEVGVGGGRGVAPIYAVHGVQVFVAAGWLADWLCYLPRTKWLAGG